MEWGKFKKIINETKQLNFEETTEFARIKDAGIEARNQMVKGCLEEILRHLENKKISAHDELILISKCVKKIEHSVIKGDFRTLKDSETIQNYILESEKERRNEKKIKLFKFETGIWKENENQKRIIEMLKSKGADIRDYEISALLVMNKRDIKRIRGANRIASKERICEEALEEYKKWINGLDPISKLNLKELEEKISEGKDAIKELVDGNMSAIASCIDDWHLQSYDHKMDAFNTIYLDLPDIIERYDCENKNGASIRTFIVKQIEHHSSKWVNKNSVSISKTDKKNIGIVTKAENELRFELGMEPTYSEISAKTGFSEKKVNEIINMKQSEESLDDENSEGHKLADCISYQNSESDVQEEAKNAAIADLNTVEKAVYRMVQAGKTQKEIAKILFESLNRSMQEENGKKKDSNSMVDLVNKISFRIKQQIETYQKNNWTKPRKQSEF